MYSSVYDVCNNESSGSWRNSLMSYMYKDKELYGICNNEFSDTIWTIDDNV